MGKYAVAALKDTQVVGHLTKGKSGHYTKTTFYFLRDNQANFAVVTVKGKRATYGEGQGLRFPAQLNTKEKSSVSNFSKNS